jgi:hypothetical protein
MKERLRRFGPYVALWLAGEALLMRFGPFGRSHLYEVEFALILLAVIWLYDLNNRPIKEVAILDERRGYYRLHLSFYKDLCYAEGSKEEKVPRASKQDGIGGAHCLEKSDDLGGGIWVWLEER